jgi:hypothetical protein
LKKKKKNKKKKLESIKDKINKLKIKLADPDIEQSLRTEIEKQIRQLNMQLGDQKPENVKNKEFNINSSQRYG